MTLAVLLSIAPLLALLCALLLRRYPGEQAITWLRARRAATGAPRRPRRVARTARRCAQILLPRGGRLVAAAVAARPPPRRMTHLTPSST